MQHRLYHLSGIAFVALVLVATLGLGGSTPGTGASGERLASFYSDNTVRQGAVAFLLGASVPLLVLFGIGLATTLATRASGGLSPWGYVLIAGTILVAGAALVTALVHFALASGADDEIAPTALQALNSLDGNTWVAFNPAFGVMMVGAAGVLLSGAAHRWLGWIALVFAVALFIPFADFFALLGTLLWIVVASVVQLRGQSASAPAVAPTTA